MKALRVCAWNILHGGGTRRTPEVALALLAIDADVFVVCEYRRRMGGQLRGVLADHGWRHQVCTEPPEGVNGILLAGRVALEPVGADPPSPQRFLAAYAPDAGVHIAGVHIPDDSRPTARRAAWRHLVEHAREGRDRACLLIGDLNTGRDGDGPAGAFSCAEYLGLLWTFGYRDAFRECHKEKEEFTWVDRARAGRGEAGALARKRLGNKGFRIDAAHVSGPLLPRLEQAEHVHGLRERGVSDHSALVVSLGAWGVGGRGMGRSACGKVAIPGRADLNGGADVV